MGRRIRGCLATGERQPSPSSGTEERGAERYTLRDMKVQGEILYHIPRISEIASAFQSSTLIKVDGDALNQSMLDVLTYQLMVDLGEGKGQQGLINALYHDKDMVARKMIDWPETILSVLPKTTRRYAELVFESVRVSQFPELPSRQTCIYLSESSDVEKWYAAISPDGKAPICEIEATGNLHKADQRWLQDNDVLPHSNFVKNAEGYWGGEPYARDTTWEILFVGELRVIQKFDTLDTFRETLEKRHLNHKRV